MSGKECWDVYVLGLCGAAVISGLGTWWVRKGVWGVSESAAGGQTVLGLWILFSVWWEAMRVLNQFSSVQLLSLVRLFATLWTAAHQASLSLTISWSLPEFMSITPVMPSSHLILCQPLLLLSSIFPSIRTGKGQSSSQFPRRAVLKNVQIIGQLHSSLVRSCSKSCMLGFSITWTKNFQMSKLGLEKAEEPEIKLPTFVESWASLVAQRLKRLPAMWETWDWSLGREDPWRRKWQPTPVFLLGKSHGQRSLMGHSP